MLVTIASCCFNKKHGVLKTNDENADPPKKKHEGKVHVGAHAEADASFDAEMGAPMLSPQTPHYYHAVPQF